MTRPEPLERTTVSISRKAHDRLKVMQERLKRRLGYKVSQSETVIRGMEALEREQENQK